MKKTIYSFIAAVLALGAVSCESLDQYPITDASRNEVYKDVAGYQSVLGGIYATFLQRSSDVSTETRSQNYYRVLWMFQDASTDAMDAVWLAGESLTAVNGLSWTAGDSWVSAMYYHIYKMVAMTNELIRNASDENISGFSEEEQAQIAVYRNEARFIRAWAYSHALDFYYKMPFLTESNGVGTYIPDIYDRRQMFEWLVGELADLAPQLKDRNYGHANKFAAYALLARLYLNSGVYLDKEDADNKDNYTECLDWCKLILDEGGYSLESDYAKLFNADNHLRTNEIIFALAGDGTYTTTWDATTFITCGSVLGNLDDYEKYYGTQGSGAWNNLRARPQLVDAFEENDSRALLLDFDHVAIKDNDGNVTGYKETLRSKDITKHDDITEGYRLCKWTNLTDAGESSSLCSDGGGADTDIPVFRLADVYLMIAEAVVRGGEGYTQAEALDLLNDVRERAFGSEAGNVSADRMTLDFLCQERLREMYMECIRRTDLIRFGKYTTADYMWQWKAGVMDGTSVDPKYNYLPAPEAEYSANPGMKTANNEIGY